MPTLPKASSTPRILRQTIASASAGPFSLGFRVFDTDGFEVYVNGALQTLTTDYTISATFSGGYDDAATITFTSSLSVSDELLVYGQMVADREEDLAPGSSSLIAKLNIEQVRHAAMISELQRDVSRAPKFLTENIGSTEIQANRSLVTNSDGDGLAMGPTIDEISNAQGYAEGAGEAEAKAEKWASNPEDTAVETGPDKFSALHHAAKAADAQTASETARDTSQAWAESATAPGGAGTKSSKTHATEAAASAGAAATSETNAGLSETAAAASETAAGISETNAAASAGAAATSETNAGISAGAASTSETNAAASETATANLYDAFDDRYLGAKAADPTLDNDGNALITGALYFNTASSEMRVWDGSDWLAAYVSLGAALLSSNDLSDLASAGAGRTNLGVAIGTDVQAYSASLDTYAANALTSGEIGQLQNIGATTVSALQWGYLGAMSSFGGTLVDDADAAGARTTLELGTVATKGVTGADAAAVTGTAGTNGSLAAWNGDGDLVDGKAVQTTISNTDESVPTSGAVVDYVAANSGGGATALISSVDISDVATVDFTGFDAAEYDAYFFVLTAVAAASDNVALQALVSDDGGSTFETTNYDGQRVTSSSTGASGAVNGSSAWEIAPNVGNTSPECAWGTLWLKNAGVAGQTTMEFTGGYLNATGTDNLIIAACRYTPASVVNAVRFQFSSGNLVSGQIYFYGVKNS